MDEVQIEKCKATIGWTHYFPYLQELSRETRLNRLESFRRDYPPPTPLYRVTVFPSAMYEDPMPPDERNVYEMPLETLFVIGRNEMAIQQRGVGGSVTFTMRMMSDGGYTVMATHGELRDYAKSIDPDFDERERMWEDRANERASRLRVGPIEFFGDTKISFAVFQTVKLDKGKFFDTGKDNPLGPKPFGYVFIQSEIVLHEVHTHATKKTLSRLPKSSFLGASLDHIGNYWQRQTRDLLRNTCIHAIHYFIVLDEGTAQTNTVVIVRLRPNDTFVHRRASLEALEDGLLETLETLVLALEDVPCDENQTVQAGWYK